MGNGVSVRMHAEEVATDVALVRRLLAAQFPAWAALPLARVPSWGTDNALFRLGDAMVVRVPRIHWAVPAIEKERRWLPWLTPRLPVAIPRPLAFGAPGEGYPFPWSVHGWIHGENPRVDKLDDPRALAADLAGFLLALRSIDPDGGPPSGSPAQRRDPAVRAAIEALSSMDEIDVPRVTAAWDAALRVPTWPGEPVWMHGDLAPGNVLVADGRLVAVIDWGGVGVGDPADDCFIAWNLLPAIVRDEFHAMLGVDDDTRARGRGRALAQALVQLPYYRETNPPLAASARHVIADVLADVSTR